MIHLYCWPPKVTILVLNFESYHGTQVGSLITLLIFDRLETIPNKKKMNNKEEIKVFPTTSI